MKILILGVLLLIMIVSAGFHILALFPTPDLVTALTTPFIEGLGIVMMVALTPALAVYISTKDYFRAQANEEILSFKRSFLKQMAYLFIYALITGTLIKLKEAGTDPEMSNLAFLIFFIGIGLASSLITTTLARLLSKIRLGRAPENTMQGGIIEIELLIFLAIFASMGMGAYFMWSGQAGSPERMIADSLEKTGGVSSELSEPIDSTSEDRGLVTIYIKKYPSNLRMEDLDMIINLYNPATWNKELLGPPAYPPLYKLSKKADMNDQTAIWYSKDILVKIVGPGIFVDGSAEEDVLEEKLRVLPSTLFAEENGGACTDSDGGANYHLKGTVTCGGRAYTDYCDPAPNTLIEYVTDGRGVGTPATTCPKGCRDGACME